MITQRIDEEHVGLVLSNEEANALRAILNFANGPANSPGAMMYALWQELGDLHIDSYFSGWTLDLDGSIRFRQKGWP